MTTLLPWKGLRRVEWLGRVGSLGDERVGGRLLVLAHLDDDLLQPLKSLHQLVKGHTLNNLLLPVGSPLPVFLLLLHHLD